jgi:hypothetical protein
MQDCQRCGDPAVIARIVCLPDGSQQTKLCPDCFEGVNLGVYVELPSNTCPGCGHPIEDHPRRVGLACDDWYKKGE